jgi:probable rRNA maturation factor
LGWGEAELSLTILGDRAMARLNRETFGRSGPTNVIAFPVDNPGAAAAGQQKTAAPGDTSTPPAGPPPILGEVAISVETTRRQALEFGWPWEELLDFYLIHGILHLAGHDHDTPENEAAMTARTWELMAVVSSDCGEGG